MRKLLCGVFFAGVMAACVAGVAQESGKATVASHATRYFKLTMVLTYPVNKELEPVSQSITTEVAVFGDGRSGSCKTRMTSQVPVGTGLTTKFIDVGTKFDCNDVRIEGDGLAMSIVLETSRLRGMVALHNKGGDTEEPVISQRNLVLAVKLPLDAPKVIFDSKNVDQSRLKRLAPLGEGAKEDGPAMQDEALQVEMTASELK